jgi:hypothetical protein
MYIAISRKFVEARALKVMHVAPSLLLTMGFKKCKQFYVSCINMLVFTKPLFGLREIRKRERKKRGREKERKRQ